MEKQGGLQVQGFVIWSPYKIKRMRQSNAFIFHLNAHLNMVRFECVKEAENTVVLSGGLTWL